MALNVFLSHSLDPTEQALAWRLQTLSAAHGIKMYVPQRVAPQVATSAVQNAIDRADCVLAIITAKANANVQKELKYALAKKKLVIPIVQSDFATHPFVSQFSRVFTFSPEDYPGKIENEIVEFLKKLHLDKEKQQAIGALAALAVGLLLLFSLTEK